MTGGGDPSGGTSADDLSGDGAAAVFGRLFDEHYRPLHRYLARRVGEHTADDLAAETFLVAYRERRRYDPAAGTPRGWLYGIATNLLRHHHRHEVRGYRATAEAAGRSDAPVEGHDVQVAQRVDAQRSARQLAAALALLDPGDRDVLLLSCWAGLDGAEIAAALGIPPGTVRSRMHRTRKWLRAHAPAAAEEQGHG